MNNMISFSKGLAYVEGKCCFINYLDKLSDNNKLININIKGEL